ncbi:MAG: glycosyltransferase family 2 protein [Burkholderiaceae bacterium]|jgi:hyaluronan synthase|nr:glycosyltransferase family 2 protein [Burkholderiaceae bacterium]
MRVLAYIIFAMPLLVYLVTSSGALIARLFIKNTFIQKNYNIQPSVSVLMPCFNEGAQVLNTIKSIIENDYPSDKIEVVAVDDCSADDTYQWLQKAEEKWPSVRVFKNAVNLGKHNTLTYALGYSSGEIIICIDSDTIFDKNVIKELTACYVDESIGAVGGRVGVSNPKDNVYTQAQTFLYYFGFQITKMLQNCVRNATIISGALFSVRRKHFEAIQEQVKQRNWLGIHVREGEDRYMTHLLLLRGLKTYINIDAECWTTVPNNFKQLFMQQLRWRRGTLRDFFWTLHFLYKNLKMLHPITIATIIMPCVITLQWPIVFLGSLIFSLSIRSMFFTFITYWCLNIAICSIMMLYAHKYSPEQKINPLIASALALWFVVDCFMTVIAVCTFDNGTWGTRGAAASSQASS